MCDADLVERRARLLAHRAVVQERQRAADALAVEEHVVEHRQLVDEREVLVDGVDARAPRLVDAVRLVRLAAQGHLAHVGLLEAADDLHQRRLAGAVVAEQPEHLALAQVQVDVAQRDDGPEVLRDVLDAQDVVASLARHAELSHPTPSAPGRRRCWRPSRR